jgi:hypothetical protein
MSIAHCPERVSLAEASTELALRGLFGVANVEAVLQVAVRKHIGNGGVAEIRHGRDAVAARYSRFPDRGPF